MSLTIKSDRFNLIACNEWIQSINCRYVCLYFLPKFFPITSEITASLQQQNPNIKFVVHISSSSNVDTISIRVRDQQSPDAVIYFGTSCLCRSRYSTRLPTFFASLNQGKSHFFAFQAYLRIFFPDATECEYIRECLDKLDCTKNTLFMSDVTNSTILKSKIIKNFDAARFSVPQDVPWHFQNQDLFEKQNETQIYPPYVIPKPVNEYELVIFVGECNNLEFIINCTKLVVVDPQTQTIIAYDGAKEFRKRVSLIEKFKSQTLNLFGIVFLDYAESVKPVMSEASVICKRNKKVPYFITLNQSDYEMRLGNFTQLEGFVLVNSCVCNLPAALGTAKYFYPVIFWKEFLVASGKQIIYGGIEWNQDVDQEAIEAEDTELEQDVDKMKIVERDLFRKPDGWFGLTVDAGDTKVAEIKEGHRGIASSYDHELF